MWRGENEGWLAYARGDPFIQLSLIASAWLADITLLLVVWNDAHFRSSRLVRVLFSTGPNHLSQNVRHHSKSCMALGWLLASVTNNPLGAPGSIPLYLCLPPTWDAVGGNHCLWDHYGNQNKKTDPQDLKEQRDSPSRRTLEEILQQGAGSSSAPLKTSKPAAEISAKHRAKPVVRNLPEVKPMSPLFGVSSTDTPSTSSIPPGGEGLEHPVSGVGGLHLAKKALSGCARWKLK
jgi:hypothetical protein